MLKKNNVLKLVASVLLISMLLSGCGGISAEEREIKFADAGWDSIKFHNAVAGTILEELYGYSWSEVSGSTPVTHQGILSGEIDGHMEIWTANISSYEEDKDKDRFKELGTNFDDNFQVFYVPRYVIEGDSEKGIDASAPDLKYVWDLKKYPDVFKDEESPAKGRVYGGIPGWEVDQIMH
ncbi:MAG: ABC transporter permease, partial [Tissierellia bacterium]|nr:ABC transporter permease [Tissierellia bacterium]